MEFSQAGSASAISFHKFPVLHGNYFTESFQISFEMCFFLLLTFLWFFITILHSYVTANICAKQYLCTFYTFFLNITIKNCNSKVRQENLLLCENIYNIHDYMTSGVLNYLSENQTDKKLVYVTTLFFKQNISISSFSYYTWLSSMKWK